MSNPVTPTDDLLAKLARGDEYLLIALRDLFDQAGTVTPTIIEETIIAVDSANTTANQANASVDRLAAALESIALAPKDIIESDNGELLPVAFSDKPQDDLSPPRVETPSPDNLTPPIVNEQIQDDLSPPPSADLDVYIINELTSFTLQQLQNIDSPISNAQWVFLGDFNQALTTTSNVTFASGTFTSGLAVSGGITTLKFATNTVLKVDSDTVSTVFIELKASGTAANSVKIGANANTMLFRTSNIAAMDITSAQNLHMNNNLDVDGNLIVGDFSGAANITIKSGTATDGKLIFDETSGASGSEWEVVNEGVTGDLSIQGDLVADVFRVTRATGDIDLASDLSVAGTTAIITSGSGSPEGVVTAPISSRFGRTDGGANTSLYVKESGTGNTGWVAK